jgi:hypothetical protein
VSFILIGAGFFGYTLVHGLMHVTDSLTQVVVPGSAELNLQPGQYAVFLEEQSTVNGKIYSTTESISGLSCRIHLVPDGPPIPMTTSHTNVTYSVNDRSGRSVLEFSVKQAGRYAFACDYGADPKGPDTVVAVGSGVGGAITRTVLGGLGSMFGGGAVGVIMILAVVFKREREKKRLRSPGRSESVLNGTGNDSGVSG